MTATIISVTAQPLTERYGRFLTQPEGYVCLRTADTICIDGIPDEAVWQHAPLITRFTDISGEGYPTPRFRTQARMLWDDRYLYIAAELQEPDVWANLRQRDTIEAFGLTKEELNALPSGSHVSVEAISHKYEITVTLPDGKRMSIDEMGCLAGETK